MDLRTYIEPRGRAGELAKAVGVHVVLIRQWAAKSRPVPPEHCAQIDIATGGLVPRWELRPLDWHRIWPELIGAEGAPAVPRSALAARAEAVRTAAPSPHPATAEAERLASEAPVAVERRRGPHDEQTCDLGPRGMLPWERRTDPDRAPDRRSSDRRAREGRHRPRG